MNTLDIALALIIGIPLLLMFVFLITGFITSKINEDENKSNPMLFIIVFIIVLIALIFGFNITNELHMFRP